jgi:hypothetical protein
MQNDSLQKRIKIRVFVYFLDDAKNINKIKGTTNNQTHKEALFYYFYDCFSPRKSF